MPHGFGLVIGSVVEAVLSGVEDGGQGSHTGGSVVPAPSPVVAAAGTVVLDASVVIGAAGPRSSRFTWSLAPGDQSCAMVRWPWFSGLRRNGQPLRAGVCPRRLRRAKNSVAMMAVRGSGYQFPLSAPASGHKARPQLAFEDLPVRVARQRRDEGDGGRVLVVRQPVPGECDERCLVDCRP